MAGETLITVVGNLTADPELRYTQSGLPVVNFTVASAPRIFDRTTNEWRDGDTMFLRCNAWRQMAEHVAKSLSKGTNVIVQGSLVQREYETKEGEKRRSMELEVVALGPTLTFATAVVTRAARTGSPVAGDGFTPQAAEPWAATPVAVPA